jgi:hypothetical protein
LLTPAPTAPPPPTARTHTVPTPAGTVQLQVPTVVNLNIVSPFVAVVTVGLHVFAIAGTGIETNRLEIKPVIRVEISFDRAAPTFVRTKPNDTFTSLLE